MSSRPATRLSNQFSQPILPGNTIGVLGSGQLGRMFAISARRMGYRVHTYSPDNDTPTGQVADLEVTAPYEDLDAVRKFAGEVAAVTFEFENVPAATAAAASEVAAVRPAGRVLHITQHRLREKQFLSDAGIPVTPFRRVSSRADLDIAVAELRLPAILKTVGFGYDGKGQFRIKKHEQLDDAWRAVGETEAVLEAHIDFECEISVVAARSADEDYISYGAIENHHANGILDISVSPARIDRRIAQEANQIAETILEKLEVVGVLCVEFFVTRQGHLLVNELAPRPHNSGHLTVDAYLTSQFEQQLRAVCLLPFGATKQWSPAAMTNLLGDLWEHGEPNWLAATALENVKVHLYGKNEARPGRKMGHITALASTPEEAALQAIRARDLLLT